MANRWVLVYVDANGRTIDRSEPFEASAHRAYNMLLDNLSLKPNNPYMEYVMGGYVKKVR